MRAEPAPAEKLLWQRLRNRRLGGFKFRRQHPLGVFIADFYCHEAGLVVELDGASHLARSREDVVRTSILHRDGHRVIRFLNCDVFEHRDAVLEAILRECQHSTCTDTPSP